MLHIDIERILHIARRMILRDVGAFKVIEVQLDLRPFFHAVPQTDEQVFDLALHQLQRMDVAHIGLASLQGDVDLFLF